jgi:hypothetical protein
MEPRQDQHRPWAQEHRFLLHRETFEHFMHECRECQHELALPSQVCAHCGPRLATPCLGCGHPLPPAGAPACVQCGVMIPQEV